MAKKRKFKVKHLTPDQVITLEKKGTEDLFKELRKAGKAIADIKQQKRDSVEISEVKKKIQNHYDKNKQDEQEEIRKLKLKIKEIQEEMKRGAEDLFSELKEINREYREDMAPFKEKVKVIDEIIDNRS